jgi:hypothetical protein
MEQVLITASTVVGAALALLALLAIAIFIDIWSQARADILIYNAVADYELRRALDKSLDNFCRKCIHLMVQELEEERSRGLR